MRSNLLKTGAATLDAGAISLLAVGPAQAVVYQSSDQWASYSIGGYTIYNDEWGSGHNTQTLWVNSATDWGVYSTQPSTSGVKSYANESKSVGKALNSPSTPTSSFNDSLSPSGHWE